MTFVKNIRLYIDSDLILSCPCELNAKASHYLCNVMRCKEGDVISCFNERNGEFLSKIIKIDKKNSLIEPQQLIKNNENIPDLWILFAPLKKDNTDFVIEKATELGVTKIIPVITQFTNTEKIKDERLLSQAIEAAEQCERLSVPKIEKIVINNSDLIDAKDVIIMVTKSGYLKATNKRSIESSNYGDFLLKQGDILLDIFESNTANQVVLITKKGLYISIPCHKIKQMKYKDLAEHLNNIITLDSDDKIIYAFSTDPIPNQNHLLLICSKNGNIKRVKLSELTFSKSAKSSNIMNLKENDEIVSAQLINENTKYDVVTITKNGYGIRFESDQIPIFGKTSVGVRAQKLNKGDEIIGCIASSNEKSQLLILANRGAKRIYLNDIKKINRAGTGSMVMNQVKNAPYELINLININARDIVNVLNNEMQIHQLMCSSIPLTNLDTRFTDTKLGKIVCGYKDN